MAGGYGNYGSWRKNFSREVAEWAGVTVKMTTRNLVLILAEIRIATTIPRPALLVKATL